MGRRDIVMLQKILSEIAVLQGFIKDKTETEFLHDEQCKRAVCMTLLNIGELVKNLTDEIRHRYSDIPWREIAGLRDVTAHHYHALEMGDIWETIQVSVPPFKKQVELILNDTLNR